jgi:hypothetical protein
MDKQMELLLDTTPIEDMLIIGRRSPTCIHLPRSIANIEETHINTTTNITDEKKYDQIFNILELMKNGAMVSDDDKFINEYRELCLEQAFFRFTTDVLPDLLSRKIITCNERYRTTLINLKCISDKKDIRPDVCDICTEKFKPY